MRRLISDVLSAGVLFFLAAACHGQMAGISSSAVDPHALPPTHARISGPNSISMPESDQYKEVQSRLAQGWNTWDVNSVATHVLLPDGLAIHVGLQHNTTEGGDAFLATALIGRQTPDAEKVIPGLHSWDGSYTELRIAWKGHEWRLQSAHDDNDLVLLATPLTPAKRSLLAPTIVFSADYLWNRSGSVSRHADSISATDPRDTVSIYCTSVADDDAGAARDTTNHREIVSAPVAGPYFAVDFTAPIGVSTGHRRTLEQIRQILQRERAAYESSLTRAGKAAPIVDAIQTTLGWDTIYEAEKERVVSPVSRVWSVSWGGYVIFDWDTFFAASLAGIGDRDLAYADAIETLREETAEGFVPNYARAGGWKSSDRSEPPVGSITVLGLYEKFHDLWLIQEAFEPLLRWNRWWAKNRDIDGYLTWGSDGENEPANLNDDTVGTRQGAILESGLDNSPMYDNATYDKSRHQLEYADVGLMSMYIADCDALAQMATALGKADEAHELTQRSARYRNKLAMLWNPHAGIFLNRDLHTGEWNARLSPTNFYPLLAKAASPDQAQRMIREHLLNPREFWGQWIIPSIERDDPAYNDQNYWRGRIWGPMNYLVYLGLRNYDDQDTCREFASKSYELFLKEWTANGHVHENYNATTGSGDDVANSDRFYHWGALLGLIEYMQETSPLVDSRGQ